MPEPSPVDAGFVSIEEAGAHDVWFRAKVERSLANPGPGIPHDEVMARAKAVIDKHRA